MTESWLKVDCASCDIMGVDANSCSESELESEVILMLVLKLVYFN